MRRHGRPVAFRNWDDFNRAMDSLRRVEDWIVAAGNLPVDREFQSAPGNVTVRVSDVADSYGVYPGVFLYRALDDQTRDPTNWIALTDTVGTVNVAGVAKDWDGAKCTVVPLDDKFPLEKDRRYEGRIIGYWGIGDGTTGSYQYNAWPVVLAYAEEKWHFKITGYNSGADLYSGTRCKANGDAHPIPLSLVYRIQRFPSNVPSPSAGTPNPPVIQNDQVKEVKTDPDRPTYFYFVDPSGGQLGAAFTIGRCVAGVYTEYTVTENARDLIVSVSPVVSPPPPPPPPVPGYYCVGGQLIYAASDPPPKSDCGPFPTGRVDCSIACAASTPLGGVTISDGTTYTDPYTVGATVTPTLSAGGSGGPYHWGVFASDPATGQVTSSEVHTGSSFSPTLKLLTVGTVDFQVVLTDDATPGDYAIQTISRTVNPPARTVRTANYTAVLTDDAFQVVPVDATAGPVTVTLYSANGAGVSEVTVIKIDASANAVTVAAPGPELLRATAGGTVSLATRWAAKTFKTNNLDTHYDR